MDIAVKRKKKTRTVDMTTGPFVKKIIMFALPLMAMGLLQLFYNTADTVVVGRFAGTQALAAVGSTGSLINLILNIFMGLSVGSGVTMGVNIGANDEKRISDCTHTTMLLSIISGFTVGFIGFVFSSKLLVLMNVPEEVLDLASLYLKIYFLGAPGSLMYNYGASLLRAMGDTQRPLYVLLFSGAVNIVLNIILVVPFKLGVIGVATATIVSQYISAAFIVSFLHKLDGPYCLHFSKLHLHSKELKNIIKIGLPAGLQGAVFSISNVIIQTNVNSFGDAAMAGIAAGSNYDGYIYIGINAFTQATISFTSQNIGAKKYSNATKVFKICLLIATIIGIGMSSIGYFFSEGIVSMFSKDSEVIKIGAQRLAQIMPFYIFCGLQDMAAGEVRSMGKSFFPMVLSIFGTCVVRLCWVFFVLPLNHTLVFLYWAYPISWFVTFIGQFALYFFVKPKVLKKDDELKEVAA